MSEKSTGKKKVVRQESAAKSGASKSEPTWKPTPEAKKSANQKRIFAWILWILAIAVELFAIFWILKQVPVVMWQLIVAIVVTGVLALGGSLLWKQANRLDPASKKDAFRFWVQNQLGGIITMIAFLPLIVLIFMNKDMDSKQKGIAGGVGIAVMVIVGALGFSYESPSQELYAAEQNIIVALTGKDEVYWTRSGSVFHVCDAVPAVNMESQDGQIYQGTIADAHADGKDRLTKQWESEARLHCGYSQEQIDTVKSDLESGDLEIVNDSDEETDDGAESTPAA